MAAMLVSVLVGCRTPPPPEVEQVVAGRHVFSVELERRVPVVYDEQMKPDRLTDEQLNDLLSLAAPYSPRRVWFVFVHDNGPRPERNASIYFVPTATSGRLRSGEYLAHVYWMQRKDPDVPKKRLRQYYQISMPDVPFDATLRIPVGALLPFEAEGMSEEEIVAVVDFIRKGVSDDRSNAFLAKTASLEPIVRMFKDRTTGDIHVTTGPQQHGLAGSGEVIELEKTPNGLRIRRTGLWIS